MHGHSTWPVTGSRPATDALQSADAQR